MKIITCEVELRKYLPNVFATVKGEVSLFDKVKVDIDLAENWVIETFVSTKTFNRTHEQFSNQGFGEITETSRP